MSRTILSALALCCTACAFPTNGTIGDLPVIVDTTIAAWVDSTVYDVAGDEIRLETRGAEDVLLHLFFSGALFDPGQPFSSLSGAERLNVEDEIARSDSLHVVVRRGDRVISGDEIEFDSEDPVIPGASPFISAVSLDLGQAALGDDAEYPDKVRIIATGRRGEIKFNSFDDRVAGQLRVQFFRSEFEVDDGRARETGELEVSFDAPLLPERVAECNFDRNGAGLVDPCSRF